jgi:hypothetical protein
MENLAGTLDGVAFLDRTITAESTDIELVGLTLERMTKERTSHVIETPDTTGTVVDIYKPR